MPSIALGSASGADRSALGHAQAAFKVRALRAVAQVSLQTVRLVLLQAGRLVLLEVRLASPVGVAGRAV